MPVFGLLKRDGKVYTAMIPDTRSQTLVGIVRARSQPDGIIHTDSDQPRDILDVSEFHHQRINHQNAFADRANYINGIENFRNQAKRYLRGYGIPKAQFHRLLKECEWRFNYRSASSLLAMLTGWANPDGLQ